MNLGSLKEISDWLKDHNLSELILIKKFYNTMIERQNREAKWDLKKQGLRK